MKRFVTDFLFATPSWIHGVARILDLAGDYDLYNSSPTADRADFNALLSDHYVVGYDLQSAIVGHAHDEGLAGMVPIECLLDQNALTEAHHRDGE